MKPFHYFLGLYLYIALRCSYSGVGFAYTGIGFLLHVISSHFRRKGFPQENLTEIDTFSFQ